MDGKGTNLFIVCWHMLYVYMITYSLSINVKKKQSVCFHTIKLNIRLCVRQCDASRDVRTHRTQRHLQLVQTTLGYEAVMVESYHTDR